MRSVPYVILGGGAAAFSAATRANDLGVETVMINAGLPIGGTCVNVGCVPSKHLLHAASRAHAARRPGLGVRVGDVDIDYGAMKADRDRLVLRLRDSNYQQVLQALTHVQLVEGRGRFEDAHTVIVGSERFRAERVLVAVGARPRTLPVPGWTHPRVVDNVGALELEQVPESLVVVGAGAQGMEWAQAFARLGSQVLVLEALAQVLPPLDADVAAVAQAALEQDGVRFELSACLVGIEDVEGGVAVRWLKDGVERRTRATHVLKAVGVQGNADGIAADRAGLTVERGFLQTNAQLRTSVPHIFAAGDVIGHHMLEHAAGKEGVVAAANALSGGLHEVDYASMPAVVFTDPEAAFVGPTERDYMRVHGTCRCRAVTFDRVPRALATGRTLGIARLTVDHVTDKVVGAQMVCPHAGEAIHEMVVAIRAGLTVDELIETVHAFPTYSEAFKTAALAFRRDVSVMACCIG